MVQGNGPRGSEEEGCYADEDNHPSSQEVAEYSYRSYPASTYLPEEPNSFIGLNPFEESETVTVCNYIPLEFPPESAMHHSFNSALAPYSTLSDGYMPVWDLANQSPVQIMQTPQEDTSGVTYRQGRECLQVISTGVAACDPQLAIPGDHGGEANVTSQFDKPFDIQPGLAEADMATSLFYPVTLAPFDVSSQYHHTFDTESQSSPYLVGDWPIVSAPGVCGATEFDGLPPWTHTTRYDASFAEERTADYSDLSTDLHSASTRTSGTSRPAGTAHEIAGGVSKTTKPTKQRRNLQNPTFLLESVRRNEAETKFGSLDCHTNDEIYVYEIGPTEAQASVSARVVREKAPDILYLWGKDRLYAQNTILGVVKLFGRDDEEWPYFFKEVTMRRVARIFKEYHKATAEAMLGDSTSSSVVLSTEDSAWVCTVFPIIWEAWNNPRRIAIEGRVRLQKVRKVGEKVNMKDL